MASAMTATTPSTGMVVSISGSGLLDRDALDDVGNLLERVGGVLEAVDDGLDLDQVDRVGRVVEEGRHHLAVERIGLVLETVDLDPVALEVLHRAQARHGVGGHLGHAGEDLELLREALGDLTHAVQHDEVCGLLDVVHAVVEGRGEVVDVLAVERRDERAVHLVDELVRRVVRGVLQLLETVGHQLPLRRLDLEESSQLPGRLDEELGSGGEEIEKTRVLGGEAKTHGDAPVDRGLVRGRCYGLVVIPVQPSVNRTFTPFWHAGAPAPDRSGRSQPHADESEALDVSERSVASERWAPVPEVPSAVGVSGGAESVEPAGLAVEPSVDSAVASAEWSSAAPGTPSSSSTSSGVK